MLDAPMLKATILPMVDPDADLADCAAKYRMLMNLHVEVAPTILLDALVLPRADPEESELSVHIAMTKSATQKPVVIVEPEARVLRPGQNPCKFLAEGVVNILIGVKEQDPRCRDDS